MAGNGEAGGQALSAPRPPPAGQALISGGGFSSPVRFLASASRNTYVLDGSNIFLS